MIARIKFSLIKHLIALGFFCGIVSLQFIAPSKQSIVKTKVSVSAQQLFLEPINQEIERVWQEFEKMGLNKNNFALAYENKNANNINYLINAPKVGLQTEHCVKNIVHESGMNPDNFQIISFNKRTPAAVSKNKIYVNESLFNILDQATQRFVIKHELTHVKYKDDLVTAIIESMLGITTDTACTIDEKHPLCRFSRLQETRADIEAAIQNKDIAYGFHNFVSLCIARNGNKNFITHPQNNERLALAQKIVDYFS